MDPDIPYFEHLLLNLGLVCVFLADFHFVPKPIFSDEQQDQTKHDSTCELKMDHRNLMEVMRREIVKEMCPELPDFGENIPEAILLNYTRNLDLNYAEALRDIESLSNLGVNDHSF